MKILPVLDLLDGLVVRGIAGRRNEYRPVESRLAESADVSAVAQAFRERLRLHEFYVADLDAIIHDRPNCSLYRMLADDGFRLIVDAGIRSTSRACEALASGAADVIAGLETSPGPAHLSEMCNEFGATRVIFSLDLKAGSPMGDLTPWKSSDPLSIAKTAIKAGVQRIIVLDLAQVGVDKGLSTIDLCRRLIDAHPHVEVITGGGVRGPDDLRDLARAGIHGALVASALHDGRITRTDIKEYAI